MSAKQSRSVVRKSSAEATGRQWLPDTTLADEIQQLTIRAYFAGKRPPVIYHTPEGLLSMRVKLFDAFRLRRGDLRDEDLLSLNNLSYQNALTVINRTESPLEMLFWGDVVLLSTIECPHLIWLGEEDLPDMTAFWGREIMSHAALIHLQHEISTHGNDIRVDALVDGLKNHKAMVVELDGFSYHSDRTTFANDRIRDRMLTADGYTVRRYSSVEFEDSALKHSYEFFEYIRRNSRYEKRPDAR